MIKTKKKEKNASKNPSIIKYCYINQMDNHQEEPGNIASTYSMDMHGPCAHCTLIEMVKSKPLKLMSFAQICLVQKKMQSILNCCSSYWLSHHNPMELSWWDYHGISWHLTIRPWHHLQRVDHKTPLKWIIFASLSWCCYIYHLFTNNFGAKCCVVVVVVPRIISQRTWSEDA